MLQVAEIKRPACLVGLKKLQERQIFPAILEDHVVPWTRRWQLGAGLMGEQGVESIHAHLHKLESQYCGLSTWLIGSNML